MTDFGAGFRVKGDLSEVFAKGFSREPLALHELFRVLAPAQVYGSPPHSPLQSEPLPI